MLLRRSSNFKPPGSATGGQSQEKSLKGCKFSGKTQSHLTSVGWASLDELLGGGIPLGSILTVKSDYDSGYCDILLKSFISQGILHGHTVILASLDTAPRDFVTGCPSKCDVPVSAERPETRDTGSKEKMKIAWRYNTMNTVDQRNVLLKAKSGNASLNEGMISDLQLDLPAYCHPLDLVKPIDPQLLREGHNVHFIAPEGLSDLLVKIEEALR